MIKVLLVEDEPPIGRAVKKMIEQCSPQFVVVGCEINGQAAIDRLRDEPVDVVITDIRMPVMDGIELMERIKTLYPDCITAILSGYQDFTYAQAALRLGAEDYLLKPVSKEQLQNLLGRIEDKCAGREVRQRRELLLHSLRGGVVDTAGDQLRCRVLLCMAGAWPLSPDDSLTPGAAFWNSYPLEETVEARLGSRERSLMFEGKAQGERIIVLENVEADRYPQFARELYARLKAAALPLPVTICAQETPASIGEIGSVIRALRAALYTQIRLFHSQLLWDDQPPRLPVLLESAAPASVAVEAIITKNREMLKSCVAKALKAAESGSLLQSDFVRFLDTIICDQRLNGLLKAGIKLDISEAVTNAVTRERLTDDLLAVFGHFDTPEQGADQKAVVEKIEAYLRQNYNKTVTNEMLSRQFGFVPSYVSKIFRRQKGVTPSEYVTRLRMERAKAYITEQPEILIRDVAGLVGYNDPYYFSKAFKKETGLWPSEYQRDASL